MGCWLILLHWIIHDDGRIYYIGEKIQLLTLLAHIVVMLLSPYKVGIDHIQV
jgi:hypothetical protein